MIFKCTPTALITQQNLMLLSTCIICAEGKSVQVRQCSKIITALSIIMFLCPSMTL